MDRSYLDEAIRVLAVKKWKPSEILSTKKYLSDLFKNPDSKRAVVRAVVENITIGGEPKYKAVIKLRGYDKRITLNVERRSPYRRRQSIPNLNPIKADGQPLLIEVLHEDQIKIIDVSE